MPTLAGGSPTASGTHGLRSAQAATRLDPQPSLLRALSMSAARSAKKQARTTHLPSFSSHHHRRRHRVPPSHIVSGSYPISMSSVPSLLARPIPARRFARRPRHASPCCSAHSPLNRHRAPPPRRPRPPAVVVPNATRPSDAAGGPPLRQPASYCLASHRAMSTMNTQLAYNNKKCSNGQTIRRGIAGKWSSRASQ